MSLYYQGVWLVLAAIFSATMASASKVRLNGFKGPIHLRLLAWLTLLAGFVGLNLMVLFEPSGGGPI